MAIRKYRLRDEKVTTEQLDLAIQWERIRIDYCTRMGWQELVNDAFENLQIYTSRAKVEQ